MTDWPELPCCILLQGQSLSLDNSIPAIPRRWPARTLTRLTTDRTPCSRRERQTQDYSSTRGVEVRFTRIPLIATLMAVALSLLIVLPALAQGQYDDPRGTLDFSDLSVSVMDGTSTTTVAESYFQRVLYVSNSDEAHHVVRIRAAATAVGDAEAVRRRGRHRVRRRQPTRMRPPTTPYARTRRRSRTRGANAPLRSTWTRPAIPGT